jgi:hypothetical protein
LTDGLNRVSSSLELASGGAGGTSPGAGGLGGSSSEDSLCVTASILKSHFRFKAPRILRPGKFGNNELKLSSLFSFEFSVDQKAALVLISDELQHFRQKLELD